MPQISSNKKAALLQAAFTIYNKRLLFQDYLAIIQALYCGECLITDSFLAQEITTMLECLLDDEAHCLNLGTSLLAEIHNTLGSVTIGEEVVDEDNTVFWS